MASALSPGLHAATGDGSKAGPIRVGQIGVGHGHANKLSVYRRSPDFEVVGIVEPDPELRERAQAEAVYRDLPWMTQDELLNVAGLQAVLVETEVHGLLDAAEACVAAGKHVHLDKPAGESFVQYQRILQAAGQQGLMVQMGYMYRYNPAIVLLQKMLREGWLGEVFEIHAVMSKVVAPGERRKLARYPGGMMFELGCHLIDLVVGVLGEPDEVTSFGQHAATIDDGLRDNTLAVATWPKAMASVKSSAQEYDGGSRRHFVVCGTEGTFHIQPLDNPAVRLTLSQPRGEYTRGVQTVTLPKYQRYVEDAAVMARVIRGEQQNDFSYEHDRQVQSTVLRSCGLSLDT